MDQGSTFTPPTTELWFAGRYRVEKQLGRGGMGIVYAVVDTTTGRRLALKHAHGSVSVNRQELFKREFHTLHGLRHPNIIEVYDYGNDAGRLFYTMELLEGSDLGQAAPMHWRQVCSYVRQIAVLLGLLHARRLLHRDVSPRNIWVLPDGRLKLIDFGALSPFGVPSDIVGTPPMVAPEWLFDAGSGSAAVDQRADLYALGALAYWLLTGIHAYPAATLEELPRAWAREPSPPSSVLRAYAADRAIPPALDSLIAALLRRDLRARPESTERVIDRLDAIAGAGPAVEPTEHAIRGCLRSKAFVGRSHERQVVEHCLRGGADAARVLVFEGRAGLGRSRLLEESALLGSLSGATSVLVRSAATPRAHGVVAALALGLLERLPAQGLRCAQPYAAELARISPALARKLGVTQPLEARAAGRDREALHVALSAWLCELAEQRSLLLLVDDLERCDDESLLFFVACARKRAARILFVAAMLQPQQPLPSYLPLQRLRELARVRRLAPLTAAEVQALLCSVFGAGPYLGRIADVIGRASAGNPRHCLELIEHLVDRGLARYSRGTWALPGELLESELPRSRGEMHIARLAQLSAPARELATQLSVHEGPLTRSDCIELCEQGERTTTRALMELTFDGVLCESQHGYSFVTEDVREAVMSAAGALQRKRAHARMGALLAARAQDPLEALQAGLHLGRAGDVRALEERALAAVSYQQAERDRLRAAAPLFEQAVALLRDAGVGPHALVGPLAALADASYFVDRRFAARYGREAIATFERVLCLDRARSLAPYVGKRAARWFALVEASLRRPRGTPSVRQQHLLLSCAGSLHGVAISNADRELAACCRAALEPLAVRGDRDGLGLMLRSQRAVASMLCEDYDRALRELNAVLARMDSAEPIHDAPEQMPRDGAAGLALAVGIMECWRMNPAALSIAERLEGFGQIEALSADQLRAVYYLSRGENALAHDYRQRVEARALALHGAWQVVTLGAIDALFISLWTHDALLGKQAAVELERVSALHPTLSYLARHARGTYLVLCGRYREAIETLSAVNDERELLGWSRGQGVLARAYNRLGEHARAREICRAVLAGRSEAELDFVVMYLHVELELSLAEAALGERASARERMLRLIARHSGNVGPLALGAIHETRARIALIEHDFEMARLHVASMRRAYAPTQSATLLELADQLAEQLAQGERDPAPPPRAPSTFLGDETELLTRVHVTRVAAELSWRDRARRGLRIALELTGAQAGFVLTSDSPSELVHIEDLEPEPEVVDWARTLDMSKAAPSAELASAAAELHLDDTRYRAFPLGAAPDGQSPARLVLAFRGLSPCVPDQRLLAILAGSVNITQA